MSTINITKHIVDNCTSWNKTAFVWRGESINYSEFFSLTEKIAARLKALDVMRGQRILLSMNDTPATIACFLGALWIGAVPVPLNPRLSSETFKYILKDSEAVLVICESASVNEIRGLIDETMADVRVLVQDLYPRQDVGEAVGLCNLMGAYEASPFAELHSEEGAYWQYTSGTTGKPKAVIHHSWAMIRNAQLFGSSVLGITSSDRVYSTAKLFFGYGLGNSLFFNLLSGATALLDDRWPTPEILLENTGSFAPTIFFSTPSLYNTMYTHGAEFKECMADKARYCSAGAHLPTPLFQKWKHTFDIEILDGIGATEVSHIFLCNRPGRARAGVTGKVVPGYEVRLLDKNGSAVGMGTTGVLWVSGPSVGLGYHNRQKESLDRFRERWYRTGDVFVQDKDENYTYVGREDELFKSKGRWVSPMEIETHVMEKFSEVSEVAVVPTEDKDGLTVPTLCLVMCSPILGRVRIENIENRIRESMSGHFDSFKQPKHYYFFPTLPKNENGKLIRSALIDSLYREMRLEMN